MMATEIFILMHPGPKNSQKPTALTISAYLLGLGLTLLPSFNVSGLHMICMIMQRQHQVSRFIGNVDSNVTQTPS